MRPPVRSEDTCSICSRIGIAKWGFKSEKVPAVCAAVVGNGSQPCGVPGPHRKEYCLGPHIQDTRMDHSDELKSEEMVRAQRP